MARFRIVANKAGDLWSGDDEQEALRVFDMHCDMSERGIGRAADQDVQLFDGRELIDEYSARPSSADMVEDEPDDEDEPEDDDLDDDDDDDDDDEPDDDDDEPEDDDEEPPEDEPQWATEED